MTRMRILPIALLALFVSLITTLSAPARAQIYLPGAEPFVPPKDSTLTIKVSRLAPGVYAAKLSFVWTGWVETPEGILIIDSGMDDKAGAALADTIRARSPNKPFQYLVLTHAHDDHILGAKAFLKAGATLVAQESVVHEIDSTLGIPDNPAKEIRIRSEKRLGTTARPIDVVWLGHPADSKGDVIVHLPKQRVLFAGDLVSNKSVPWLLDPNFSKEGWFSSLDSLMNKRFAADVLVPGHGLLGKPGDGIRFTRNYILDADAKATRLAGWGQTLDYPRRWGYLGPYEGMEFYQEVHFMNMKRLLAEAKGVKTRGRGKVRALRQ